MKKIDVRPMLARGEEPFDAIMSAVAGLEPGEELELTAPLDPIPLYSVLGARGFQHQTEALGGGDYRVVFRPEGAPSSSTSTAPLIGRARELASFSGDGFGRRILFENDRLRVVLAAFEPGQEIPVHAPGVDLVLSVLEGMGEVRAGDQVHPVAAGDVVIVPAGEERGVRARTRMVALHVVSPPPTEADHAAVAGGGHWPSATAGPSVAQLILEEHAGLFPHLEDLGHLADEIQDLEGDQLGERLGGVLAFLKGGLLPHAEEEERSVYPAVERALRAVGGGTDTMSADHVRIRDLIAELEALAASDQSPANRRREQALLDGLRTVLELHFTKENERYLPLLDLLPPQERARLHEHLSGGHQD
jgi:quercetin dioxygenase-like cupin family protein/uncharacterized protein (DUF2249 family)